MRQNASELVSILLIDQFLNLSLSCLDCPTHRWYSSYSDRADRFLRLKGFALGNNGKITAQSDQLYQQGLDDFELIFGRLRMQVSVKAGISHQLDELKKSPYFTRRERAIIFYGMLKNLKKSCSSPLFIQLYDQYKKNIMRINNLFDLSSSKKHLLGYYDYLIELMYAPNNPT